MARWDVAFYRPADRLLISGDALLTIDVNSPIGFWRRRPKLSGPPRYTTWDWPAATTSISRLAALRPRILAPGHGQPLSTGTAAAVSALVNRLTRPKPVTEGVLRPVDYTAPVRYRRPPRLYRRLQPLGYAMIRLGLTPGYVVLLEVPGRRSGVTRRTNLVRADLNGQQFLVSLAGESDWVRNVRAAGGHVTLGRRREPARLIEVPPADRPAVIRAYLYRAGRDPDARSVAREARHYFGVAADATTGQLDEIADRYPVFRILRDAPTAEPGVRPQSTTPRR